MVSMWSMTARTKERRSAIAVALPHDVVVHIVGLVAASSPQPMTDFCSLQAICKAMYKTSKERTVGRRMAVEREEAMKWLDNERYLSDINHLADAGNPKACFIVDVTLVFMHQDMQQGLMCLDRKVVAGHKAARYVLGLLLYTAGKVHDGRKHYISQVEGLPAGGGCETAKWTNQECRRCQRLAVNAVQEATWKKLTGPQGRVLALPEDGHRCTSTDYSVTEGWGDYVVLCSTSCRIRHGYTKFFA